MDGNRNSQKQLLIKIGLIIALILLLMIPIFQIQGLVHEREGLRYMATSEIEKSWGGPQVIRGPLLSIPVIREVKGNNQSTVKESMIHFLPESYNMTCDLRASKKSRSIYEVMIYSTTSEIELTFNLDQPLIRDESIIKVLYQEATLSLGISDTRGLTEVVSVWYEGKEIKFGSGTIDPLILDSGISAKFPVTNIKDRLDLSLKYSLNGARSFHFQPFADESFIYVKGDWSAPGFNGGLLPTRHEINESGFSAHWQGNVYHRNQPSSWIGVTHQLNTYGDMMGLELIQSADHYQKNLRSIKYAILVICLTFLTFFFFEIFQGKKIHPIQYGLIGLSLSLFYMLLLSFTEHIGFNKAYLLSAHATIALIAFYSYYTLKNLKNILLLSGVLILLYTYIFVLMQLETYALLTGSIGLFVILTAVMFFSRKLDWYNLKEG